MNWAMFPLLNSRGPEILSIWDIVVALLLSLPFLLADLLVDFTYRAIPFIFTILSVLAILLLLMASIYAAWRLVTTSIHLLNSLVGFGTIAAIRVNKRIESRNREAAMRSTHANCDIECCSEELEPCERPCCHQCCSHGDRRG